MPPIKREPDEYLNSGFASTSASRRQPVPARGMVSTLAADVTKLPYNLPPHITLDTEHSELFSAMLKARTKEESEIWNDMANPNGHANEPWAHALHKRLVATERKRKAEDDIVELRAEIEESFPEGLSGRKKKKLLREREFKKRQQNKEAANRELPSTLEEGEVFEDASIGSFGDTALDFNPWAIRPKASPEEGGIWLSSDEGSQMSVEPNGNRQSNRTLGLKTVNQFLAHGDIIIWKALQRTFKCDGKYDQKLGFSLPQIDIQAIADIAEKGHRSQDAYNQLGCVDVPHEQLQLIQTGELNGFIIYDSKGIPVVLHIPRAVRVGSLRDDWNKSLVKLRRQTAPNELLVDVGAGGVSDMKKAETLSEVKREDIVWNVKKEDEAVDLNKKRRTFKYFPTGTLHLSFSWKSLYNNNNVDQMSDFMVTGGGSPTYFVAVQEHFRELGLYAMFQNYILYKLSEGSFQAYLRLRACLRRRFAAIGAAAANNPSLFSGLSYAYNEPTDMQFRDEGSLKGWTPLALAGTCKTGRLAFPGLGVKFDYRPGDITVFRGRLIKHGVVDWEGDGNHISIMSFNHYTEWEAGEVQSVW